MKAVILCTGYDKGLAPINERTPDSMLKFAGVTAAQLAVRSAHDAGADEIFAACDYLADRVRTYFETADFGSAKPVFVPLRDNLSEQLAELADGGDLLVIEVGAAFDLSLGKLVSFYNERRPKIAAAAVKPSDGLRGCKIRSDANNVTYFGTDVFSPDGDHDGVFAGAAVLSSRLLEDLPADGTRSLAEIISREVSEDGEVSVYYDGGWFQSLHSPQAFLQASAELLKRKLVSPTAEEMQKGIFTENEISLSGITLIPPVYIGRNVTLGKGCVIEGAVIGDNAVIGARAEIRGGYVGESADVGAGVRADRAVICAGAQVRSSAQLGEYSAIGERAVVGSGAQIMPGVKVNAGKRTAAGDIISENVVSGSGRPISLDDECCCGFSTGVSAPYECTRFAAAVGSALDEGMSVVCGCSGGEGAKALLASFESGLVSSGITVLSVGESTEQEVMFLVNRLGADIGCYISADFSERIKLMSRGGLPLEGSLQSAIERAVALDRTRSLPFDSYGVRFDLSGAKALYRIFLSQLLPKVFHGVNADVRCSAGDTARLADSVIRPRNDTDGERIIFHISNDGRTATAYTDKTGYVINERLVLLAVKAAFEKELPVSLPYTFPMAADKLAEQLGGKLYRYFHAPLDGSDGAARLTAQRPDNFFVRDGMVLVCMICAYLSERRISLSEAMEDIPSFYSAQRFAAATASPSEIYRKLGCRREGCGEGIVIQSEGTRAMVRPLRHRQGLIIFAESVKAETASELCDEIIKKLKRDN